MKIVLSLIAVVMMSACSHMGRHDHHAHENGKCTHCESGKSSDAKGEKCKNGCH